MLILIDNGHDLDTPGKRSPNVRFLEATYTREIARRVVADLIDRGYNAELLVPEYNDISLEERVRRVNQISLTYEPASQSHRHGRPRLGIPTSSSSASTSTPPETAHNGSMLQDGPATPAKDRQPQTSSPNASTTQQKRTSQADASEQTALTPTPTGKKTSISSATPYAPQSSQKTSSWTIFQILSTYRADHVNRPLRTLM